MQRNIDYTSYFLQRNEGGDSLRPETPFAYDAENPTRTVSSSQYASAIKRVAVAMASLGLKRNDCVALISQGDLYNWVLGDGVVAAGGVFCPFAPGQLVEQLSRGLQTAKARWMFASRKFFPVTTKAAELAGIDVSNVILFDPPGFEIDGASKVCKPQCSLAWMLDNFDSSSWSNPNSGHDPSKLTAFRFFTSGTTGLPKAANLSHATSLARLNPPTRDCGLDMKVLQVLGQHHSSAVFNWARAASGQQKVYISPHRDVPSIMANIHRHGITDVFLHPRMLDGIAAVLEADAAEMEKLKSLICISLIGDLVQEKTLERCRRVLPEGIMVKPRYGLTEAGAINRMPDCDRWSAGEVGFPDGVKVKIIDPETLKDVGFGYTGEICVSGPRVFDGYENIESSSHSILLPNCADDGEYFRTGDQGTLQSPHGRLKITGRYKEMFRVGGANVVPKEVEGTLLSHPSIVDAVVTSTVSRKSREDLECLAYLVACGTIGAQDVLDFMESETVSSQVPTGGIIFCQKIPRNDVGKVQKNGLRDVTVLPGSMMYL